MTQHLLGEVGQDSDGLTVRILRHDLSRVGRHLERAGSDPAETAEALREYLRYMALVRLEGTSLPMTSPAIDEVWHAHIVHTQDYALFCQEFFGVFVHHSPADELPDPGGDQQSYSLFAAAYERHFGAVPELWSRTSGLRLCVPTGTANAKLCIPTGTTAAKRASLCVPTLKS